MSTRNPFRLALGLAVLSSTLHAQAQTAPSYELRTVVPRLLVSAPSHSSTPSQPPVSNPAASGQLSTTLVPFGNVALGVASTQQVLLSSQGTSALTLGVPQVTGAGLSASTQCTTELAPGESCLTQISFLPLAPGLVSGSLTFSSNASNAPLSVTLTGTGVQTQAALSASTSADFATVAVGASASRTFTFTNTGSSTLANVRVSLPSEPGLSLTTNTCGTPGSVVTLAPNASCSVTLTWAPTSAGTLSGELSVLSYAENSPHTLSVSGTATEPSTGELSGNGNLGQTYTNLAVNRTFTFSNTGSSVIQGAVATVTGTGVSITGGTCGTTGNPKPVQAGTSCTVNVRWTPTSVTTLSGSVRATSDAANSPSVLALTGTSVVDNAFYASGKTFIYVGDMNYDSAQATCSNSTERGYTDWRVPTLAELNSLVGVVGGYSGLSSRGWPNSDRCYWSTDVYNATYQKGKTLATNSSCTNYKAFNFLTTCVR